MKRISQTKRGSLAGLLALTLGLVTTPPAVAAPLALSDVPLFIDLAVEPNIVLTIDDSGSMEGCDLLRKGISSSRVEDKKGMTAKPTNGLAYDPKVEYFVPVDADGVSLGIPSFTGAWIDGYNKGAGTRDLSTSFLPCWDELTDWRTSPLAAQAAYYHTFSGNPTLNSSSGAGVGNQANYTQIVVGSAADVSVFDGQAGESNLEKGNFAIWFSYYRNRLLAMKSAAGLAFADGALGGRARIAQQTMWGYNGNKTNKRNISLMKLFGKQSDTDPVAKQNRVDFFNWLYGLQNTGGTPLPYSMHKAGLYYRDLENLDSGTPTTMAPVNSPWAYSPGLQELPRYTCRQAFHVMMTDGEWYDSAIPTYAMMGDVDGVARALPDTTTYNPFAPYKDTNPSNASKPSYLGDVAFHYWATDLQPTLANDVPAFMPDPAAHPLTAKVQDNPKNDPATWQHMVNFTVGFGVNGNFDPSDTLTYNNLVNGTLSWGDNRVDDLWHAAINSRGTYVSAQDPQELVNAFSAALNTVLARTSSGAGIAQTAGELSTDTRFYQGRFNSGSWTGRLLAFDVDDLTGFVQTPEMWDAATKLTTQVAGSGWDTGRTVLTFDGSAGVPFRWASLSASMQADLNKNGQGVADALGSEQGDKRLEYLRGSAANEGTGNNYRVRASKLGDIVGSAPVYVGDPAFFYPDNIESAGEKYSTFKANKTGRTPMVYVGGNDGMLHGFDASTLAAAGTEKLAYVPNAVFPNLTRLTATNYAHRFFVDGSPTAGDAFWSNAWHTVLVGGLNKGGQGIYALDVTDPANFTEANAASLVLWEYTDANDVDLGYTYSRPAIVKMTSGSWAAVFGNGYNNTDADGSASTSGNAVLYIVNVQNGSLIKKLDTGVGLSDAASGGRPNGLTTPTPVDVDGDRITDLIYAGDLYGNLWKFDVRGAVGSWSATKLFVAKDAGGTVQPITAQPDVGLHPDTSKSGFMVYIGTGKYIESGDNIVAGAQTQTFYGIWDPDSGVPPYARNKMLKQQILEEKAVTINSVSADVRISSDNAIAWAADPLNPGASEHVGWYMDLVNTQGGNTDPKGERQVTTPFLRNGRIIFTTLIPSGSSCVFGGDGWLMELDAADGSRLTEPPFDIDGDGVFDVVTDAFGNLVAPSGVKSTVGAPSQPAILDRGDGTEVKTISGSYGGGMQQQVESGTPPGGAAGGRESWQQLR